ncbi:NADH dehydrogenase [ubiquinone] 1 beta subcomplex subunit 1 [Anopheles bellator]|uniref:NADH dehydrogenase [ubiquinone] 1 beta subcomplex subunit 1 n=1 Tax=Anopheles cruzii TaxID=68878 RepID=UPI0022EC6D00|nr:NADH dehydrogenase [ubiquinone] 1 beta subcomplex subunit 1 [Anopheles cruzii]XP_058061344.1 NADH dehydrogenase [ubiquinone] 1 beta subcomplex subunit 1 [Anopheles bellator]
MVLGLSRQYLWTVVPLLGFWFGSFLDDKETERMTMFRDKSALYGRTLKEGEKPSWP